MFHFSILIFEHIFWMKPQCYIQWVYKAPLCITLRIKTWVAAYFDPPKKSKKNYKRYIVQLFIADATMFSKKLKTNFAPENTKKPPSKVAHSRPQTFFSSTGPAAQTSPELIFHVLNMSQDASVLLSVPQMKGTPTIKNWTRICCPLVTVNISNPLSICTWFLQFSSLK